MANEAAEPISSLRGFQGVQHYRPKERPHAVRVLHHKTREESWVPLFDDAGVSLYPELA
jgi:hypothetical protein